MKLFERLQHSEVRWDEPAGELVVRVSMQDAFHGMGVEVHFRQPDLVIARVLPWAERTPYPICPEALGRAQACVGLRVAPAVSLLLQRQIGGPQGCSHITRLVTEACHAAVQGLLARRSLEEGRQGAYPSAEKVAFLEEHGLPLRNSCVAYDLDRAMARPASDVPIREG